MHEPRWRWYVGHSRRAYLRVQGTVARETKDRFFFYFESIHAEPVGYVAVGLLLGAGGRGPGGDRLERGSRERGVPNKHRTIFLVEPPGKTPVGSGVSGSRVRSGAFYRTSDQLPRLLPLALASRLSDLARFSQVYTDHLLGEREACENELPSAPWSIFTALLLYRSLHLFNTNLDLDPGGGGWDAKRVGGGRGNNW